MANKLKFGNGEWYGKEGFILAYNDEGGNYKPLPFNFSCSSKRTVINKEGLIKTVGLDQPRVDYKDSTKGAMLLERTSTNYIQYSEDFSQSYWLHNAEITTTNSSELSPNGSLNANLIEYDGSGYSFIRIYSGVPSTASTLSVFAKKGNWRYFGLRHFQSSGNDHTVFDFDTETFSNIASGQTASFEVFPDGWYKIKVTHPSPASSPIVGFAISNSSGSESNTTGGQVANVHLFGAQLEQQPYATSYIPNYGTSAGVTRSQDIGGSTGDIGSFIGNEGVFELTTSLFELNSEIILCDGTDNNRITFRNYASLPNKINISVKEDNSPVIGGDYTFDSSAKNKFQVFFGNGKVEIKINDALVDSENVNTNFSGKLDVIRLANASGTTNRFKGRINEIKIYNTL